MATIIVRNGDKEVAVDIDLSSVCDADAPILGTPITGRFRATTNLRIRTSPAIANDNTTGNIFRTGSEADFSHRYDADGYTWLRFDTFDGVGNAQPHAGKWVAQAPLSGNATYLVEVDSSPSPPPSTGQPQWGRFGNTYQPRWGKMVRKDYGDVHLDWSGHSRKINGVNVRRAIWMTRDPGLQHYGWGLMNEMLDMMSVGHPQVSPLYAGVIRFIVTRGDPNYWPHTITALDEFMHNLAGRVTPDGTPYIRAHVVIADALQQGWPSPSCALPIDGKYFTDGFLNPRFYNEGFDTWKAYAEPILELLAQKYGPNVVMVSPLNEPTLPDNGSRTKQNADAATAFLHDAGKFIYGFGFPVSTGLAMSWHITAIGRGGAFESEYDRARTIHNTPYIHAVENHAYFPNRCANPTNQNPTQFDEMSHHELDVQVAQELNKVHIVGEWESNNTNNPDGTRFYDWAVGVDEVDQRMYDIIERWGSYYNLRWGYSLHPDAGLGDNCSMFGANRGSPDDWPGKSNTFREQSLYWYNMG